MRGRTLSVGAAAAALGLLLAAAASGPDAHAAILDYLHITGPSGYLGEPLTYEVWWQGPLADFEKSQPLVLEIFRDEDIPDQGPFIRPDPVATFEFDLKGKMKNCGEHWCAEIQVGFDQPGSYQFWYHLKGSPGSSLGTIGTLWYHAPEYANVLEISGPRQIRFSRDPVPYRICWRGSLEELEDNHIDLALLASGINTGHYSEGHRFVTGDGRISPCITVDVTFEAPEPHRLSVAVRNWTTWRSTRVEFGKVAVGYSFDQQSERLRLFPDLREQVARDPSKPDLYRQLVTALRQQGIQDMLVFVDGLELALDVPPTLKNGRTLVPFRGIAESLGAAVQWHKETSEVVMTRGNTVVRLVFGHHTAYINDRPVTLDVPAQVIDGRTLVPLRFVSEALDAEVAWDPDLRFVQVLSR